MKHGQRLHVTTLIPPSGPVHASQFVEWLLLADNINPNLPEYSRHKAALTAAFVAHMGGEVVDASSLRWSDCGQDMDQPDFKYRGRIADNTDDVTNAR
ncbi:hypothetical protein [Erythrobacter sp. SG61-1L]|uniref:hypothetical protein n=1 Tax=Erythrobacter sp. SG61-1L TaxID=1603897 RepID=UPI0012E1278A|nr:hypothetical protein [Erythrobacter sp. SG61-1L]